MLKTNTTKRIARKTSVFASVFAVTGVLMGSALMGFSESDTSQATFIPHYDDESTMFNGKVVVTTAEDGSYEEFVMLVQRSNETGEESADLVITPMETPKGFFGEIEDEQHYDIQDAEVTAADEGFVYVPAIPLSAELQQFTYERCEELDLEYELVLAVMWRESRFQTNAVGYNTNGTRDSGIMQINDVNRGWLREQHGITNLMDPYENITAGTLMLADYMHSYDDENMALMAYHYGTAGMQKKVAQGITTNRQVEIAQNQRDLYRNMIENA